MAITLAFQTSVTGAFQEVVEAVTLALKQEGFGVLARIDVQATLKEKLNEDFRPYVILGACNPVLAKRALESEPTVGILLPCNVTVEESDDGTLVSIVNPEAMMGIPPLIDNPEIQGVAFEAKERLKRVFASL